MFAVGSAVVLSREGEQSIGEVAGVRATPAGTLYDVSVEEATYKGVFEDELAPATAEAIRAMLGWYAVDPQASALPAPSRELVRLMSLRAEHAKFLNRALRDLAASAGEAAPTLAAAFAVGDVVAVIERDVWQLGTVVGVVAHGHGTSYDVDVLGTQRRLETPSLRHMPCERGPQDAFALGDRVRFLAQGHEHDDEFRGTVCAVEHAGTPRYAIMFDDGDIIEHLWAEDLALIDS